MTLFYPPLQNGLQKTLDAALDTAHTTALTLNNVTGIQNKPGVVVIDRIDSGGTEKSSSDREFVIYTGTSESTLTGLTRAIGGSTDQDHAVGAVVEFVLDITWAQAIIDALTAEHGSDGTHAGSKPSSIGIYAIDEDLSLVVENGIAYFTVPEELNGMDLSAVHARVITAPTGAAINIQIANVTDSVDMLSTVLSIDATEFGSDTAETPAVIDTDKDGVVTNDLLRIDVDQIGSTIPGKGLIVRLRFS